MEKVGLLRKIWRLSKPRGNLLWKQAIHTIILMIIAGVLAQFTGFKEGIKPIIITTLFASLIMDLSIPFKKVAYLGFLGAIITVLAFCSVFLSASSLPLFIFFTILWSFFTFSMYIFGETYGIIGYTFFLSYFLAAILFENQTTLIEWLIYPIIAYSVASLLLIPKFFRRIRFIRELIASNFKSDTTLRSTFAIRKNMENISLKHNLYHLLRLGTYYTGIRVYSNMVLSKLSVPSRKKFQKFLKVTYKTGDMVSQEIISKGNDVNLSEFDLALKKINNKSESTECNDLDAAKTLANNIGQIFNVVKLLLEDSQNNNNLKISGISHSFKQTIQANFNLKNMYIRHAIRFTFAMTIGLAIVHITNDRNALWIVMGILIVLKPDITSTINNMLLRVTFNLLGVIVAVLIGLIFPHFLIAWLAFLMIFLFRSFVPNYIGPSVMAMTIFIVLLWPQGTVIENGLARLIDITVGAVIAVLCAYLILPSRVTVDLPLQLSKTIMSNSRYASNILISPLNQYDHNESISNLNKFILEVNNLESAIQKLQDSFVDVYQDVELYNSIAAINYELSANISVIASKLESKKYAGPDLLPLSTFLQKIIFNIVEAIKGKIALDEIDEDEVNQLEKNLSLDSEDLSGDDKQFLQWIISDVKLLNQNVKNASESGLFNRYRKLL
ncbi:MAG: FUSC family protein [Methanobacteriaceae archaeon]|nr:FUSC family protein [Methanobacteriaceae archaeon]